MARKAPLGKARLTALIAEATVEACNESEQRTGFLTMLEEHLDMPFAATILGVSVIVERVDAYRHWSQPHCANSSITSSSPSIIR